MSNENKDSARALPAHIVNYDYDNPSPLFSKEQIDYIESIRNDFSEEELKEIRKIEWFRLNIYAGIIEAAIPGLRQKNGIGYMYVRRFLPERYLKMMDIFLDYVYLDFSQEDKGKCYMPAFRVTLPNGDQFYPFVFHGDVDRWRKRLNETADAHHTLMGGFDHGKFILSNGQLFEFSALKVDSVETRSYPKDW